MLTEPTPSDPIQNRRLTKQCWDGDHRRTAKDSITNRRIEVGCAGWLPCPVHKKDACPDGCAFLLRCECLCHEAQPAPRVRKLRPEDSLDLPDVGTIEVK